MKQINEKYATIVLGEETLRKLNQLDLQADDREQVQIALNNFTLEREVEERNTPQKIKYDFTNKKFI